MDIPPETKDMPETKETPASSEKLSPQGIAAIQGADQPAAPAPVPPADTPPPASGWPSLEAEANRPQAGVGDIGGARKIETGAEMPEKKLFTLTEEEAKAAKEKEISHPGGAEFGY